MKTLNRKKRRIIKNLSSCDSCKGKATKVLSSKNCDYCADWFMGNYCDKCFDLQQRAFYENDLQQREFYENALRRCECKRHKGEVACKACVEIKNALGKNV